MKEKILQLRKKGFSYNQIVAKLGCSKGTVAYHCGTGVKEKAIKRQRKNRKQNLKTIICKKTDAFKRETPSKLIKNIRDRINHTWDYPKRNGEFNTDDVLKKIGENPECYLTGKSIDLYNTKTYHFDHKTPLKLGGGNTLNNLEITTREANLAKSDMTLGGFLQLCQDVLENFGYKITVPCPSG